METTSSMKHPAPPLLALTPEEAARSLSISRASFYRHVWPTLRVIKLHQRTLVPVKELEAWTERNSARALD
jgi:hypothetical protein